VRMFAVWYVDNKGKTQVNIIEADSKSNAKALTQKSQNTMKTGAVMEVRDRG
jgi:type II secretory pathway component PulF